MFYLGFLRIVFMEKYILIRYQLLNATHGFLKQELAAQLKFWLRKKVKKKKKKLEFVFQWRYERKPPRFKSSKIKGKDHPCLGTTGVGGKAPS